MKRWIQRINAIGLFLAMAAGNASAAPIDWDYTVSAQFDTTAGATAFNGAGPGSSNGCEQVTGSLISWGGCAPTPIGTGMGRSGIGISNSPQSGSLAVNGAAQLANTYTHTNNVMSSAYATLASATISTTLGMRIKDSGDPYEYQTFTYTLRFSETPNISPCVVSGGTPCSDIWVLDGSTNRTVVFGGNEFIFNFFPAPAASPLPDDICSAAGAASGCLGFTTEEGQSNAIPFMLNVTHVAAVAGRVYAEGSTPANTEDNGNGIDAGAVLGVSLSCTDPSYSAGPIDTGADGSFSFEGVPVAANCAVTATPPAGFQAAYMQQGTTGEAGSPGTLNTSVAGSTGVQTITVSVPPGGSTGNLFALRPLTDMISATVCTPSTAAAGTTVNCTTTCTNTGGSTALNAFCSIPNAASLPGSPMPACSAPANVVSNGTLACTVSFTMPDSGNITVNGGTGADNDSNGGRDASSGNNPSSAPVTRQLAAPVPVPGLGPFALLLLLGLMGLVALHQHRRHPGGRAG